MLWFMAIGGEGHQVAQYKRNVKAAVVSAKHHAPSLIPQLILGGGLSSRRFEGWFQRMGGTVHRWNLSFYQEMQDAVYKHKWQGEGLLHQHGAYLRLDIPLVIERNIMGKVIDEG